MIRDMISVVMPTYNDAKYISKSINDILNQTYENFELIIVNDGSTDNTSEILQQFKNKDKRIKVFEKENGGTGSALNFGFEKAKGEFGTWVSSDDSKKNVFLEKLVSFLKSNRDIEFVCSSFYSEFLKTKVRAYIKKENSILSLNILSQNQHDNVCSGDVFIVDNWASLNYQSCMLGTCFMFTMRLKNKVGDYANFPGEDYHMTMKMAFNSRTGYIDEVLGSHNAPPDSLSIVDRECTMEANMVTRELYGNKRDWYLNEIPKIASFYWGSSKMSYLRYLTIFTFKKHNPDWSIHLYIPKSVSKEITWKTKGNDNHHKIDNLEYNGDDYFFKLLDDVALKLIKVDFSKTFLTKNAPEPHKSDLLTWQVLSSKGGLWCDMDILFYEPMTSLEINRQESKVDTVVCYDERIKEIDGSPTKPIGFFLSKPNNLFFKKAIVESKKIYNDAQYQSIGTSVIKRLANNFDDCQNKFYFNKFDNLNPDSVYYFHFKKIEQIYNENVEIPKNTIGIHWYGGHPLSQKFNNEINEKNYIDYDNTISTAIKRAVK